MWLAGLPAARWMPTADTSERLLLVADGRKADFSIKSCENERINKANQSLTSRDVAGGAFFV